MTEEQKQKASQDNKPELLGRVPTVIIITVFVVIVGIIIGIPYYNVFIAPWYKTVLQVRDTTFNMRYFIKRLRLQITSQSKNQLAIATQILRTMQNQELIKQEAIKRKITVSEQEMDKEIERRVLASATGEGNFEELYASMLRGLRLDEKEYREWVKYDLFHGKFLQHFLREIPKATEHVHVYAIVTGTVEKAEEVRARLDKNENFQQVAREESIDLQSSKKGGDLGWIPKEVNQLTATGQIHALGILTKTKEEAEKIRTKILAGEDFKKLASLNSYDDESREKGGYLGWVSTDPRTGKQYAAEVYELKPGELSTPINSVEGFWVIKMIEKSPGGKVIDDIAFNLAVNQVTPPLQTVQGYYLLKVVAKDEAHPISKENILILVNKVFNEWLTKSAQKGSKEGWIKWNWGSETYEWVMNHLE